MRVAITTSPDRIDRVAGAFSGVGLTPVALPCVRIEPAPAGVLEEARRALVDGTVVLLGSARTLDLLWPDGAPPPVPAIALGAITAEAIRARGGQVEYCGSEGIAAVARHAPLDGRRVVFPHAAGTDAAALCRIVQRAESVFAPVVYDTIPQSPDGDPVDAVAFGSPSAVQGWLSARTLQGLVVGAIGGTTARSLEDVGHQPAVIALRPEFSALAAAMATRLVVVP